MNQTAILQEVRQMKFSEYYGQTKARKLSQREAAGLLGMSERSFRRYGKRFEAEGADGLFDRRLARVPQNRVPVDTVSKMLTLFDTRYWDFTPKHFHEKLVSEHDFNHSYNWVRLTLQARGRVTKASRRGAHRRKRERRALPGMMLHQALPGRAMKWPERGGSSHEWVPGKWWDLIVTMDDATSDIYSAFFVDEEGTMSSFAGVSDVIVSKGLFCSLYADRGSHYWHTPEAGGKVDKSNPTQFGRALTQLGIELIPAYSPEARGRSERMFGTLQNRLPQELRLNGITTMEEANRFLIEEYLPGHNEKFAIKPSGDGSAFVPFAGDLANVLCVQEERVVGKDNTVRYKNRCLQIPADCHRNHYVKARVRVHEYPNGQLAVFHGPRKLAMYEPDGTEIKDVKEQAA